MGWNAVPESVINEAMKSIIKEGDASEICINDIKWDLDSNVVINNEIVWTKIFKQHPFAGAYYHTDEPQLYLLASIFGLTDVEMEDETIIIIIPSDTTKPIFNLHGPLVASLADPDEVNSPCVGGALKARRKLFVEESATDDRQSSIAAPVFYHGTVFDGSLKFKMENQPSCCPIPVEINQSKFSSGGSSTASCSPFLTSRKIAP
ncbi:hypothetical protein AAHA92_29518 [Salvia divinorum]|uniref:Uncharacterized protein n=1 Tax=Salvia divinorum TaxID=28513 RepID=A0ABD1FYM4_SALDI